MKLFNILNNWMDRRPLTYWIPNYFMMMLISFFSLAPNPFATIGLEEELLKPSPMPFFDGLHIISYFALALLMDFALRHSKREIFRKYHYYFSILFCLAFGILNELLQFFVPQRTPSFIDIGYNLIGIISAQLLSYSIQNIQKFRKTVLR